ncbi:MAG: DUF971 domain-containing protein [Candidatus Rokubacteria bacterium]|nr:DUF971 domain-containing protein [Candidatus Rokubacteria bacterium]MBI3826994.1 DUF971 domain-containing protein [Candidatus Rokubacteria bacterium]
MNRKLLLPIVGQPDPATPKDVHLVGRYALGVTWADEHGSIFPFDRLRRDCPCGACAALTALEPAMGVARDIKKHADAIVVTWSDGHASRYPHADLRALCRCAGCTGGH